MESMAEAPAAPKAARRPRVTPEERALMAQVHAQHARLSWAQQLALYNAEAARRGLFAELLLQTFVSNCRRAAVERAAGVKSEREGEREAGGGRWEPWEDAEIERWGAQANRRQSFPAFIERMRSTHDPQYARSLPSCLSRVYWLRLQADRADAGGPWEPWEDEELRSWGRADMTAQEYEDFVTRMRGEHGQEYARSHAAVVKRLRDLHNEVPQKIEGAATRKRQPWRPWEDREVLLWGNQRFRRKTFPSVIERMRATHDPEYSRGYKSWERRLCLLRAIERSSNPSSCKEEVTYADTKVDADSGGAFVAASADTVEKDGIKEVHENATSTNFDMLQNVSSVNKAVSDANLNEDQGILRLETPNNVADKDNASPSYNGDADISKAANDVVSGKDLTISAEAATGSSTPGKAEVTNSEHAPKSPNPDTVDDTISSGDRTKSDEVKVGDVKSTAPECHKLDANTIATVSDTSNAVISDQARVLCRTDDDHDMDANGETLDVPADTFDRDSVSNMADDGHTGTNTKRKEYAGKSIKSALINGTCTKTSGIAGTTAHGMVANSDCYVGADVEKPECQERETQTEINTQEVATSMDCKVSEIATQTTPAPARRERVEQILLEALLALNEWIESSCEELDLKESDKCMERQTQAFSMLERVYALVSGQQISAKVWATGKDNESNESDQSLGKTDFEGVIQSLKEKLKEAETSKIQIAFQSFKDRDELEKKIAIMRNKYSALQSHSTKLELENKRLRREIDAQTRRDNTSTSGEAARETTATFGSILGPLTVDSPLPSPRVSTNKPQLDEHIRPHKRARVEPASRLSALAAALADVDKSS